MSNYFANYSTFRPAKSNKELPELESITGILDHLYSKAGKATSGYWCVFRIKKGDDYTDVYFDSDCIKSADFARLDELIGRTIYLRSKNGVPEISTINIIDEGKIRERLLEGVAAGRIDKDDLPAFIEFAKGNDLLSEKWELFKKQLEAEGLEKMKEDITCRVTDYQKVIDGAEQRLKALLEIEKNVNSEKERVLSELESTLILLQGEQCLEVNHRYTTIAPASENLIQIGTGYHGITKAFEKFKTQKGVYVICDGKIHLIHHAYLEAKGRAFLIGESKEYLPTKPEKVRQLIETIHNLPSK